MTKIIFFKDLEILHSTGQQLLPKFVNLTFQGWFVIPIQKIHFFLNILKIRFSFRKRRTNETSSFLKMYVSFFPLIICCLEAYTRRKNPKTSNNRHQQPFIKCQNNMKDFQELRISQNTA